MTVVTRSIQGAGWLLGLSVLQKCCNFVLNILVLRAVDMEVAGAASIQLELTLSTSLFIREGIRLGLLRTEGLETKSSFRKIATIAWLTVPFGILLSFIVSGLTVLQTRQNVPNFSQTTYYYTLAAVIEWMTEPLFLFAHSSLYFSWRAIAEASAFITRAVVLCLAILHFDQGLLAYGYAQCAYALTLALVYLYLFLQQIRGETFVLDSAWELLPQRPICLDWPLIQLCQTLTIQSVLKHVLTEGDKFILSFFASSYDMGVYSIAFHIGSMAPRILFLPIEEASKAIFSRVKTSVEIFRTILKFVVYIGLVFASFGMNYTRTLSFLLLGQDKAATEIPQILSLYCFYVLLLALNGILEAFIYATSDQKQLTRLNAMLIINFGLYSLATWIFMQYLDLGTSGLIYGNCVNMLGRIFYCARLVKIHFDPLPLDILSFLPSSRVSVWFALSWVLTRSSNAFWLQQQITWFNHLSHLSLGVLLLLILAGLSRMDDRTFWKHLASLRKEKEM